MKTPLRIRFLTRDDLPFADSVRALAGWNQTMADWERFLAAEPDGCFLAEWNGTSAGTATTIVYGPTLAWIGMVLVHPDHRRRGIGRALLERCIEHLRQRGVRCIKLDATPAGKKVYDRLGFKDEWTLTRWEHQAGPFVTFGGARLLTSRLASTLAPPAGTSALSAKPNLNIRDGRDVDGVELLDASAFGVSRRKVIAPLMKQSRNALVYETEDGKIAGYGLLREGSSALYLGPIVAWSPDTGVPLVNALLALAKERKIYWDIPNGNLAAVGLAKELGFTPQRTLMRMYLGENTTPGDFLKQFAIAAPEVG